MTALTDAQLKINMDAVIFANGTGAITAPLDNGIRTDFIDSKLNIDQLGIANGVATLDGGGDVPLSQLGNAPGSSTLYLSDGTLAANRVVSMAGNTLAFTGGDVGIGTETPQAGLHGVVTNGAMLWGDIETDATQKTGRWGVQHYTNAEQPFYGIVHIAQAAANILQIGGGTGFGNAATSLRFSTAANNTTTTGTTRLTIDNAGAAVFTSTVAATAFNGVALTAAGVATNFLNEAGGYSVPATSAAGANTQIQFNNAGVLDGSANLAWDGTNLQLANGSDIRIGTDFDIRHDTNSIIEHKNPIGGDFILSNLNTSGDIQFFLANNTTAVEYLFSSSSGQILQLQGDGQANFIADVSASSFNGVALTTAGAATNFLNEAGGYSSPADLNTNIYTDDGALTANRVVSLAGFELGYSGNTATTQFNYSNTTAANIANTVRKTTWLESGSGTVESFRMATHLTNIGAGTEESQTDFTVLTGGIFAKIGHLDGIGFALKSPLLNDAVALELTDATDVRGWAMAVTDTNGSDPVVEELLPVGKHVRCGPTFLESIQFTANGEVGIGTQTPQGLLHVESSTTGLTADVNSEIILESTAANTFFSFLGDNSSSMGFLFGNAVNSADGGIIYNNTVRDMEFRTGGNNTRMTIDSAGGVGIGGIPTAGALLTINPAAPVDGTVLLRFEHERQWQFMQTGTAGGANLNLRSISPQKTFIVSDNIGEEIFTVRASGTAGTSQVTATQNFYANRAIRKARETFSGTTSTDTEGINSLYTCTNTASDATIAISSTDIIANGSATAPWFFTVKDETGDLVANGTTVSIKQDDIIVNSVALAAGAGSDFFSLAVHNLFIGSEIVHTGFTDPTYNGTFVVTAVPSTTVYEVAAIPFVATDTGTAVKTIEGLASQEITTDFGFLNFYADGNNIFIVGN